MLSPNVRHLVHALAFAMLAGPARAQIYRVKFNDPKDAKKYAANCLVQDGETFLVGEVKSGVRFDGRRIVYSGEKLDNEFYVVNTADPSLVPYDVVDGEAVPNKVKGGVVVLKGFQIKDIQFLLKHSSLVAFASDYAQRKATLASLQKSRDANKAGTPEWSLAQVRFVSELERLRTWLDTTLYPEAAKKLVAEIDKQKKSVSKEALVQRLAGATASVKLVPTPPKLVELAAKLAPGVKLHVQESRHLRITYVDKLSDDRMKEVVALGEKIIDGFRVDFVDPYLGDDFKDAVPETPFIEFWFGPEELNAHEHFLTDWYGLEWGGNKKERLEALAGAYRKKEAPEYLQYWKVVEGDKDIEGIVAHDLGHVLANIHWNAGRSISSLPDFLSEGLGFELSLSWCGRNAVTCKEFTTDVYAKPKNAKAAERAVLEGESTLFTNLALEHGPTCDSLLRMGLFTMDDAAIAKCWSFVEYLLAKEGKPGQLWLRGICDLAAGPGLAVPKVRELAEKLFSVSGQDVFKVLDGRWREHATAVAKGSTEGKKRG